jgi:hypothetical protein
MMACMASGFLFHTTLHRRYKTLPMPRLAGFIPSLPTLVAISMKTFVSFSGPKVLELLLNYLGFSEPPPLKFIFCAHYSNLSFLGVNVDQAKSWKIWLSEWRNVRSMFEINIRAGHL